VRTGQVAAVLPLVREPLARAATAMPRRDPLGDRPGARRIAGEQRELRPCTMSGSRSR
jgi:hypothetical protein